MLRERPRLTVYDGTCQCEHDTTVPCRYGASADQLPVGSGEKLFRTLRTRLRRSVQLPATVFLGRQESQDAVRLPRRYWQDGDL